MKSWCTKFASLVLALSIAGICAPVCPVNLASTAISDSQVVPPCHAVAVNTSATETGVNHNKLNVDDCHCLNGDYFENTYQLSFERQNTQLAVDLNKAGGYLPRFANTQLITGSLNRRHHLQTYLL